MQRLRSISIENYRSIGETPVDIDFPRDSPLIILGENNSGKTNIIRAIELIFGEFHPKYKKLDDFDHFNRNPRNQISIDAEVSGFKNRLGRSGGFSCGGFSFSCIKHKDNEFAAIQAENGEKNIYVSNDLREELLCVVVNAEQNLTYQLSYTSKFTLLSKVTKAFHDKLTDDEQKVEKLKELFGNIKETFLEVKEFHDFTTNMSSIAGQMLSNMSHALEFDFSAYDPSNYFKTMKVHPTEGGHSRAIEELGTGQQQILALSFAHAYAKSFLNHGLIFILDEPEAHLHPLAQKWLAKQMFQMAQDGLQIIITTHSPYFIDLNYLDGIYVTRKIDQTFVFNTNRTKLAQFCVETGARNANSDTIIPFYASHSKPHILNGLFSTHVILVEGESEEMALPIYLEEVELDCLKEGIAIISVGGKGNLAKWWRFFKCYEIDVYICFDNDHKDDSKQLKRKEALKSIGISDTQIEELLSVEDWNIGKNYCIFGRDFETTMRNSFANYELVEKEEKERLGNSKPIIAKAVANRLTEFEEDETGWEYMRVLKESILNQKVMG